MKMIATALPLLLLASPASMAPAVAAAQAPAAAQTMEIARLDPGLDAVIAPGTRVERVATGFGFVEGPMWRDGRLWFSDLMDDKVLAVSPDGKVEMLIDHAGGYPNPPPGTTLGPNAMVPDKDGTVLLARQGGRTIVRVDDHLGLHPFLSTYQGKKLNSPNDLVFSNDGALWFTDPPFGLLGMDKDPAKELPFNAVFRYANGTLTPVITDLTRPNGIGFSPDGKTLYVSNYGPEMFVRAYDVGSGGTLSNPRVLISYPHPKGPGGPDGLKVDSAGNIWTTGPGGIRIITPQGKVLGQIRLPEVAANLAFGEDGHAVYITATHSVYRLRTKIAGERPLYYADSGAAH
jgi:gluconolactonase